MSRYKTLLECSATDRKELKGIITSPLSDPDLVIRAKAILMLLNGSKGDTVAKTLQVRPNTVSDWRKRYEEGGVEGLYDKAPRGKRGSVTRDKVLELLDEQPPEGGWSTKALAERAGTSQDTVRRALKDKHRSVSKAYIWDNEIQNGPARVSVDAVGLYLSKEETGLVIQVDTMQGTESERRSYVTTCNANLARSLKQMGNTEDGLSLSDAVLASIQQMKEVSRGKKDSFQDFLGRIIKENASNWKKQKMDDKNRFYYILYWRDDSKEILPIIQDAKVFVEAAENISQWDRMIEPWLGIMLRAASTGVEDEAQVLLESIHQFMGRTTLLVEPFEWRRFLSGESWREIPA